jgi:hypothetical protein
MDSKKMIRQAAVFVALSALAGCSTWNRMTNSSSQDSANIALRSSDSIPSAQGRLAVKGTEGPNQVVDLTVKHMAQPNRVKPGATAYVVWLQPDAAKEPINMGVLSVDKDLNGQLQFKTPFPKFEVFVTAEENPTVQAPSEHTHLLTAAVDLPAHAIR